MSETPREPALFDVEWMQGAAFSDCRTYRYSLWRHWGDPGAPRLTVIGLNPSTADETEDDPTIRRCVGFAKREGMGGVRMLNLFALRATDPKVMLAHPEPIGPLNDAVLRQAIGPDDVVVAAWGVHGHHRNRDLEVLACLPGIRCFGKTQAGFPRHPLYLRADTPLEPYP
jgi:hypothetical protein